MLEDAAGPCADPPVLSAAGTRGVVGKQEVKEGQDGPHLLKLNVPQQNF